jgi:hypothetical protein
VSFIEAKMVYASRSCNKPAHDLVALGARVDSDEHYPRVMNYSVVTDDLAVS